MESSITNKEKVDGSEVNELKRKGDTSESLNSEACNGKVTDHSPKLAVETDRCDEGGKLIFCKTCGKGYHPNCLSPPSESIPDYKDWKCPDCSELLEPIKNLKKKKGKKSARSKSSKFSSVNKPNASAESDKSEAVNKRVAAASDAAKLLMLSEACVDSMVKTGNKDKDTTKQPDQVNSKEVEKRKEKLTAELCASHKEKVALKNKGKEPLLDPRPVTPQQINDTMMEEFDQFVAFKAFWQGTLDKTTPNSLSSQLKNGPASGPEIMKTTTSRKSFGLMKYKTKPDDWSELELDALWVAVRRYGQGNWEAIHANPATFFLRKKTPQELAARWEKELLKIFTTAVALPVPPANNKNKNNVLPTTTSAARSPHGLFQKPSVHSQNTRSVPVPVPVPAPASFPHPHPVSGSFMQCQNPFEVSVNNNGKLPYCNNKGSSHNSVQRTTASAAAAPAPEELTIEKINEIVSNMMINQQKRRQENLMRQQRKQTTLIIQQRQQDNLVRQDGMDNAVQTSGEGVSTRRENGSSSMTNAPPQQKQKEPVLLLGGQFQLIPGDFMAEKKSGTAADNHHEKNGSSRSKGKHVQVDQDKDETSDTTLSG